MKRLAFITVALSVIYASVCIAAPEPAIVPLAGQWTVNAAFTHPQQILMRSNPQAKAQRYWYIILTVTNKNGEDLEFFPKCDLMTDTFHILPAGKGVSPMVFDLIRQRHLTNYPFLEPLDKTSSKLLQGEDNEKDLAVIWPDFDSQAKNIKIFITGLSNEAAAIKHPVKTDDNGLPVLVFLRKTLELGYSVKGDPMLRADADLTYSSKRWIMR